MPLPLKGIFYLYILVLIGASSFAQEIEPEEEEWKPLYNNVYFHISRSDPWGDFAGSESYHKRYSGFGFADRTILLEAGYERTLGSFVAASISYQFGEYGLSSEFEELYSYDQTYSEELSLYYNFDQYQFNAILLDLKFYMEVRGELLIYLKMGAGSANMKMGSLIIEQTSPNVNQTTTLSTSANTRSIIYRIGVGGSIGIYRGLSADLQLSYAGANFKDLEIKKEVVDHKNLTISDENLLFTQVYRVLNITMGLSYSF